MFFFDCLRFFGPSGEFLIQDLIEAKDIVLVDGTDGRLYKAAAYGSHSRVTIRGNSGDRINVIDSATG
jgi:hypothetical protein